MVTFTATLYWPDLNDPNYQVEKCVKMALGPTGQPPTMIRVGSHLDGMQLLKVYVRDDPFDLTDTVRYRHSETVSA